MKKEMNLPEIYARVCAKRADAVVPHCETCSMVLCFGKALGEPEDPTREWATNLIAWMNPGMFEIRGRKIARKSDPLESEENAVARIESHWMDLLPEGFVLDRLLNNPNPRWCVSDLSTISNGPVRKFETHPTRIEALAAYLEATAK